MSKLDKPVTRWEYLVNNAFVFVLIIIITILMSSFTDVGKRNTYCDHLRHLMIDHNTAIELPVECKDDNTDIMHFLIENL